MHVLNEDRFMCPCAASSQIGCQTLMPHHDGGGRVEFPPAPHPTAVGTPKRFIISENRML